MSQVLTMNRKTEIFKEEMLLINARVCALFRFTEEQKLFWERSKFVELMIKLPYLAGCKDPKRLVITHLMIFHASTTSPFSKEFLPLSENPSVMVSKLKTIMAFEDGCKTVIDKGLLLLSPAWLGRIKNKYAGQRDFERTLARLVKEISRIHCPELEK